MERTFAAPRPRLVIPGPTVALSAFGRILRRRRARRRLALGLALLLVTGAGWVGLRDSPLVSVEHVQVQGVHGVEAAQIQAALTRAACRQTTLHASAAALLAAVAPYRVVAGVSVRTSFPHGMRIVVTERLPAAALAAGGAVTAASADGTLLGPDLVTGSLPRISVPFLPARHVTDSRLRSELAVMGAAPWPLARLVATVAVGGDGIELTMRNGLVVVFGDGGRPHAKWAAVARVLADPSSAGATYIDVRTPERPAAGGLGSQDPSSSSGQVTATDPTAASLAAMLDAAVSGTGSTATGAGASASAGPTSLGPAAAGGPATAASGSSSAQSPSAATATGTTSLAGAGAAGGGSASSPASGGSTSGYGTSGAAATGAAPAGTGGVVSPGQGYTSTGG